MASNKVDENVVKYITLASLAQVCYAWMNERALLTYILPPFPVLGPKKYVHGNSKQTKEEKSFFR